jgi:hypothetical protein
VCVRAPGRQRRVSVRQLLMAHRRRIARLGCSENSAKNGKLSIARGRIPDSFDLPEDFHETFSFAD